MSEARSAVAAVDEGVATLPELGAAESTRSLSGAVTSVTAQPLPLEAAGPRTAERRDTARRRALALADVAALAAAFVLTALVIGLPHPEQYAPLAAMLPVWVLLNKLNGLYDRDANIFHKSTLDELGQILQSIGLGTALVYFVAPSLVPQLELGRLPALLYLAIATATVALARGATRGLVSAHTSNERVLIVGSGFVGRLVAAKLGAHPEYCADVVGFIDDDAHEGQDLLGGLDRFGIVCRQFDVERVVIAFTAENHHEDLLELIRQSKQLGLKVTIVPRLFEVMGDSVAVDKLQGLTVLGMRGLARTRSSLMLKRSLDVIGSALGLVLLAPLFLLIAVAVKLDSRGPVFFRQRRIGRDNKPFPMVKFRTMVQGADGMKGDLMHLNDADGPLFKLFEDPRVTRVGRFLRRTHLDELPQLFNVLLGEMSLVGPRPLVPDEDACMIGWHRRRLELTPGLTGPWQVLGRHSMPFEEMVKVDYLYVADWSLWNDIKLLLGTIPVVLRRSGY